MRVVSPTSSRSASAVVWFTTTVPPSMVVVPVTWPSVTVEVPAVALLVSEVAVPASRLTVPLSLTRSVADPPDWV